MRIEQRPDRYLRSPRLLPAGGGARLYAIAWQGEHERLVCFDLDAAGMPGGEREVGPQQPAILAVATDASREPQPSSDVGAELRATADDWQVEVRHALGWSQVLVRRGQGPEWLVWSARGSAAAPALAPTPEGAWVAFHHDVREDTRQPDVAKWIALRFVSAQGEVYEPAMEMRGRDRDQQGEEQSFEFPALVVSRQGAVSVLGRGSHNFWRQDLSDTGWSERQPLSDGQWGSRGRRISAIRLADDHLLVAFRDRRGLEVQRLAPTDGGAPQLRRADVRWEAPAPVVASPTRERDPARAHGRTTYFGDIQQHSAHSDGTGSAEEVYLRARWRYGDDFVALTDHESFLGKRTGPGEWAYLQAVADHFDAPGEFATLIAYEWTGRRYPGPGHKCVYLPRTGMPIVSRDDVPEGADAVARIHAMGGIASPHHIGWTGADEAGHDPAGQPVWEICSCHGCYEHADHPLGQRGDLVDQMVDVMLKRGHRFGFTASSDSHGLLWHHGEARKRDPYRTGLTAVQAPELTREAVFEALAQRRCYATSGAKILLDFTADAAPMGSVLAGGRVADLRASAVGTSDIARLELVGPEGVIAAVEGEGVQAELSVARCAAWVYARVTQHDGEMAWSSPIFFD